MRFFSISSRISLGRCCQKKKKKKLVKSGGFGAKVKRGEVGHIGGLSIEGGFKSSAHYVLYVVCFIRVCSYYFPDLFHVFKSLRPLP